GIYLDRLKVGTDTKGGFRGRSMSRSSWVAGISGIMLMVAAAGAQSAAVDTAPSGVIANGGLLHTLIAMPVTGEPYAAEQVMHSKQMLPDGTSISRNGHHAVARDTEGRVRVERRLTNGNNGQPAMSMMFVMDPVAHTLTTWLAGGPEPKSGARIASVIKLPQRDSRQETVKTQPTAVAGAPAKRPQPVVTSEDLGTDVVQGQMVTVARATTVIPAGWAGNDAPISRTHEVWTSPDLKLILKEEWNDPRTGERMVELDHLSRAEPDAALFRAPAGYQVKSALESLKEMEQKLEQSQQN
ncbi:MAG: hypothetical protein ABI197_02940, partial [Granulicella sp.]